MSIKFLFENMDLVYFIWSSGIKKVINAQNDDFLVVLRWLHIFIIFLLNKVDSHSLLLRMQALIITLSTAGVLSLCYICVIKFHVDKYLMI